MDFWLYIQVYKVQSDNSFYVIRELSADNVTFTKTKKNKHKNEKLSALYFERQKWKERDQEE